MLKFYIATESILLAFSVFPNNEQQITHAQSEPCQTPKMECLGHDQKQRHNSPSPLFLKGRGKFYFNYLPQKGGNLKNQKKGWKYSAGAGLLIRGTGTFPIKFFKGLSLKVLH